MVDDLGWNGFNFSSGSNPEMHAPAMEKLAREGVILDRHYVYPFCAPSRAAFLTGRVPGHGVFQWNPQPTQPSGVNLNLTMLPGLLKKAGYRTHQVGKWHLGFAAPQWMPTSRGFDTSFGFLFGGEDQFNSCSACANNINAPDGSHFSNKSITCPANANLCNRKCPEEGGVDLWIANESFSAPAKGYNGTYTTYLWSEEAKRIIDESGPDPFFMYLALHNVHQPVEAPPEMLEPFPSENYNSTNMDRRYYNAMHFSVDRVLANVTQALTQKGILNNTIIVVSTDNGGTFEHGGDVPGSSNFPLRGHKYSFFEGGCRGAAFVYSPMLPAELRGTRSQSLMHITDWYVTFCKMAGLASCEEQKDGVRVDGVDVWDLLVTKSRPPSSWHAQGGPSKDEIVLSVGTNKNKAVLKSGAMISWPWKIIVGSQTMGDGWAAQLAGSTPRVPAPKEKACRKACLFKIDIDERERHELSAVYPETASLLLSRFRNLSAWMDAPNGDENPLSFEGAYKVQPKANQAAACAQMDANGGFWGPWLPAPPGSVGIGPEGKVEVLARFGPETVLF